MAACLLAGERRGVHHAHNFSSMVRYAVERHDLEPQKAGELLRAARVLEHLERTSSAFRKGTIGWSKVRELTRIITPETEDAWLDFALGNTAEHLRQQVAQSPQAFRRAAQAAAKAKEQVTESLFAQPAVAGCAAVHPGARKPHAASGSQGCAPNDGSPPNSSFSPNGVSPPNAGFAPHADSAPKASFSQNEGSSPNASFSPKAGSPPNASFSPKAGAPRHAGFLPDAALPPNPAFPQNGTGAANGIAGARVTPEPTGAGGSTDLNGSGAVDLGEEEASPEPPKLLPAPVPGPQLVRVTHYLTAEQFAVYEQGMNRIRSGLRKSRPKLAEVLTEAFRQILAQTPPRQRIRHQVVIHVDAATEQAWFDTSRGLLEASSDDVVRAMLDGRVALVSETPANVGSEPGPAQSGLKAGPVSRERSRPEAPVLETPRPAGPEQLQLLSPRKTSRGKSRPRTAVPHSTLRALFVRARGRCEVPGCGGHGFLQVHHRKPWSEGGTNALEDLELRCAACHSLGHKSDFAEKPAWREARERRQRCGRRERRPQKNDSS